MADFFDLTSQALAWWVWRAGLGAPAHTKNLERKVLFFACP
jgi:hypothetical protein